MRIGVHQPHYLPWLRYFHKIAHSDVFIVLDNVQFSKNGWQNRNRIKTASGAALLTVPVHAHLGQRLDEVRVNESVPWRRKHWLSIEQSYGKCPFFDAHRDFLREVYSREWHFLNEISGHMLAYFVSALGINARIEYASRLDAPGTATERLINLIRAVGGDRYYSGAHALDCYLDADALARAGIGLELQAWRAPVYPQAHGEFAPDLSILDLLMNCGPNSLNVLLGEP